MSLDSEISIRQNNLDKKAEETKMATIYSSEKIKRILEEMNKGIQTDMNPFFHGNINYRDAGILFEYTEEEMEELKKCSEDPVYFISKYVKFLNDKGRTLVKLRDYQEEMLHIMGDEEYDEESGELRPKNRRVVLMCSRQSSKCVSPLTNVKLKNKYTNICKLFNYNSILNRIKLFLLKIYDKL